MTSQPNATQTAVFILALAIYTFAGIVMLRRWLRGRQSRRPVSARIDPEGWVSYWLPLLIVVELFSLGGGIIVFLLMLIALPPSNAPYTLIGAGGGLVFFAAIMAGLDIAWVRSIRALGRQQPSNGGR